MTTVRIGDRLVGDGQPCFIIGEIGINHNGDIELAKRLITVAAEGGCEAVKFQKRTVDTVYTEEELARPRESVFGTTNGDLKRGLEFGADEYDQIAAHCAKAGIMWSASCWDIPSVDFLEAYDPPFYKVASASLTDNDLLCRIVATGQPAILSTGMSWSEEIARAMAILGFHPTVLLHCTSTYPTAPDEINLRAITSLQRRWWLPIGFSSHEVGTAATLGAVTLGACIVERHITLDRSLWGSDQAASLEPDELAQMVADIRAVERAMGDGVKRVYESEIPIRDKLRRAR
jgi:N-acetylneuraminate synthase